MEQSSRFYNFFKKMEQTAAVLLAIAFFLPWFSNPMVNAAGYNIKNFLVFFKDLQPVSMIVAVIVWLVPIGALIIIVMNAFKKSTGTLAMITGMIPVVVVIVLVFKSRYIIPQCRFGLYLTLLGAAALLLTGACNELSLSLKKEKENSKQ
jgi:uncharacterized protein YacL